MVNNTTNINKQTIKVMVNNTTNINKQTIKSDGQQYHQY